MDILQNIALPDFKIVDMHLHLPVTQDDWIKPWRERYIGENGQTRYEELVALGKGIPSWLPDFQFPEPEPTSDDPQAAAARWVQECRRFPLERVVFATGGGNALLSQVICANREIFAGFAHHAIEEADAADQLQTAVTRQGLCGYKFLAPLVEKPLESRDFDPVFEVCHQYRLPVLIHFGILGGANGIVGGPNASPLALAKVARRFPHANFIVPHFGCGHTNDLLQLCWASPNVYVDTSGNNLWTKWTMENHSLEQLFHRFYCTIGPGRILFGTDSEWFPRGFALRYLMDQLRAVRALNMPQGDIKAIFRDNAMALLKL